MAMGLTPIGISYQEKNYKNTSPALLVSDCFLLRKRQKYVKIRSVLKRAHSSIGYPPPTVRGCTGGKHPAYFWSERAK